MRCSARADAAVEAAGRLLDPVAQLHERLLQAGGVGDEVLRAAVAEHRALRRPQAPQLERRARSAQIRATSAPAAAASATMPCVEVSSSTTRQPSAALGPP